MPNVGRLIAGSFLPLKMGVVGYYHVGSDETNESVATTAGLNGRA